MQLRVVRNPKADGIVLDQVTPGGIRQRICLREGKPGPSLWLMCSQEDTPGNDITKDSGPVSTRTAAWWHLKAISKCNCPGILKAKVWFHKSHPCHQNWRDPNSDQKKEEKERMDAKQLRPKADQAVFSVSAVLALAGIIDSLLDGELRASRLWSFLGLGGWPSRSTTWVFVQGTGQLWACISVRICTVGMLSNRQTCLPSCSYQPSRPGILGLVLCHILMMPSWLGIWRALTNFFALRNRQNLVLRKNNQVSLTIGQILGTIADNTRWLQSTVRLSSIYYRVPGNWVPYHS